MTIAFAEDTAILLYNGHIKRSQDIVTGDTLMGDDSTLRTVLKTSIGQDQMYQIIQSNGISYTINSTHKLILKYNSDIVELTVYEYLNTLNKNDYKGFKSDGSTESDISIVSVGYSRYYAWELDGNQRFILTDKTVV